MKPEPGKNHLHNLVATMILAGNSRSNLDLARIAHHQGFDLNELVEAFREAEEGEPV